jgi:excisionase family DNA binding protein
MIKKELASPQHLRLGTPKEACAYGRFSNTTLYDLINAEKIDAYKRGRYTLVDLNSIDRLNATLPKIKPKAKAVR